MFWFLTSAQASYDNKLIHVNCAGTGEETKWNARDRK